MRITSKLGKMLTGEAYASARDHTRRILFRRGPSNLDAILLKQTINPEKFREIYERYAIEEPGVAWPKYLDLDRWLEINLQRVRRLELDLGRRKRVLDLGCGTGYFLYICKYLGHDVLGLDLEHPAFSEMLDLLGVPRRIWRIEANQPLPKLGAKFDVITAHMICFNGHKSEELWQVPEWDFFLNDLATHLTGRGEIDLALNREDDGTCYTPELKEYFESRGAEIEAHRVVFPRLRESSAKGLA